MTWRRSSGAATASSFDSTTWRGLCGPCGAPQHTTDDTQQQRISWATSHHQSVCFMNVNVCCVVCAVCVVCDVCGLSVLFAFFPHQQCDCGAARGDVCRWTLADAAARFPADATGGSTTNGVATIASMQLMRLMQQLTTDRHRCRRLPKDVLQVTPTVLAAFVVPDPVIFFVPFSIPAFTQDLVCVVLAAILHLPEHLAEHDAIDGDLLSKPDWNQGAHLAAPNQGFQRISRRADTYGEPSHESCFHYLVSDTPSAHLLSRGRNPFRRPIWDLAWWRLEWCVDPGPWTRRSVAGPPALRSWLNPIIGWPVLGRTRLLVMASVRTFALWALSVLVTKPSCNGPLLFLRWLHRRRAVLRLR